jgi:hypothetical protein
MSEWGIALISFIGVVLGALITGIFAWLIHESNRKDRFRVITFEKRLETHQVAYSWCNKLDKVLNEGPIGRVQDVSDKAREWWNSNCLLLDAASRTKMLELIQLSKSYAEGSRIGQEHVWSALVKAKKAIVAGIGAEYLPEMSEKAEEFRQEM